MKSIITYTLEVDGSPSTSMENSNLDVLVIHAHKIAPPPISGYGDGYITIRKHTFTIMDTVPTISEAVAEQLVGVWYCFKAKGWGDDLMNLSPTDLAGWGAKQANAVVTHILKFNSQKEALAYSGFKNYLPYESHYSNIPGF